MKKTPITRKNAFTLIEVLIAIAILGLIMAILLPVIFATSSQSNTETTQETLGTVSILSNMDKGNSYLPQTATNIIDHGNTWFEFTLNDNQWLYHRGPNKESLALITKTIVPITNTEQIPNKEQLP